MNSPVEYDRVVPPSSKHYVYFLYIPEKSHPVYVGKGTGNRYRTYAFDSCIRDLSNNALKSKLEKLKRAGKKYKVVIAFESDDEREVLDAEAFYISCFGRIVNGTGCLYNYESFGIISECHGTWNCRSIYWRGFVFPSIEVACGKLRLARTTYGRDKASGLVLEMDATDKEILSYRDVYSRMSRKVAGNTGMARTIEIDGVKYRSMTEAAKHLGYTRGSSLLHFLKTSPHNHVYTIQPKTANYNGGKRKKIEVDGVVYESLKEAAKEHGYSNGANFKRFLTTTEHNHEYRLLEN